MPLLFLYGVRASRGGPATVDLLLQADDKGKGKGKGKGKATVDSQQDAALFTSAMEAYKRAKAVVFVRSGAKEGELFVVDPSLLVMAPPPSMDGKDALEDAHDTKYAFEQSGMASRLPTGDLTLTLTLTLLTLTPNPNP